METKLFSSLLLVFIFVVFCIRLLFIIIIIIRTIIFIITSAVLTFVVEW